VLEKKDYERSGIDHQLIKEHKPQSDQHIITSEETTNSVIEAGDPSILLESPNSSISIRYLNDCHNLSQANASDRDILGKKLTRVDIKIVDMSKERRLPRKTTFSKQHSILTQMNIKKNKNKNKFFLASAGEKTTFSMPLRNMSNNEGHQLHAHHHLHQSSQHNHALVHSSHHHHHHHHTHGSNKHGVEYHHRLEDFNAQQTQSRAGQQPSSLSALHYFHNQASHEATEPVQHHRVLHQDDDLLPVPISQTQQLLIGHPHKNDNEKQSIKKRHIAVVNSSGMANNSEDVMDHKTASSRKILVL
jgi:hypothetical protein